MNLSGCGFEGVIRFDTVKTELQLIYSIFLCFLILSDLAHSVY
jgi:hypothetical protein